MPLFRPPKPPNTISDSKWKGLQARAVEANPELKSFTHPRAVARAQLIGRNHDRRTQN